VQPLVARRRLVGQLGQLRCEGGVAQFCLARFRQLRRARPPVHASRALFRHRRDQCLLARLAGPGALLVAGRRRRDVAEQVVGLELRGVLVLGLDQEPGRLLFLPARTHQVPQSLQLVAEQFELQVALRELELDVVGRGPHALRRTAPTCPPPYWPFGMRPSNLA
jgi:hypothetical protein